MQIFTSTYSQTSEIHYTNKRVQIAEKPLTPNQHHNLSSTTTKVYSSEADDKSKAVVSSKNITGPPVYYPPNHELFTSKEESSSASRAGVSIKTTMFQLQKYSHCSFPSGRLRKSERFIHVRVREQVEEQKQVRSSCCSFMVKLFEWQIRPNVSRVMFVSFLFLAVHFAAPCLAPSCRLPLVLKSEC